jgi:hypothetical protein
VLIHNHSSSEKRDPETPGNHHGGTAARQHRGGRVLGRKLRRVDPGTRHQRHLMTRAAQSLMSAEKIVEDDAPEAAFSLAYEGTRHALDA